MDNLSNKLDSDVSLQRLENSINEGDRASLDGNFSQAAKQYEAALLILGAQLSFDFEKNRDCLNKLISVYTHLGNKKKLGPLVEQLAQIESARSLKMLQCSAEFFAQRNNPEKAVETYRKAIQLAREIRPVDARLLSELQEAYAQQKTLLPISAADNDSEDLQNKVLSDNQNFDDAASSFPDDSISIVPETYLLCKRIASCEELALSL